MVLWVARPGEAVAGVGEGPCCRRFAISAGVAKASVEFAAGAMAFASSTDPSSVAVYPCREDYLTKSNLQAIEACRAAFAHSHDVSLDKGTLGKPIRAGASAITFPPLRSSNCTSVAVPNQVTS